MMIIDMLIITDESYYLIIISTVITDEFQMNHIADE